MFIGHALLAFALAVLFAEWRGWDSERALAFGIATGAFAALPDIDVLYALVAVNPAEFITATGVNPGTFWGTANETHRLMTHSLLVSAVAGAAFGLWALGSHRLDSALMSSTPQRLAAAVTALAALAAIVAVAAVTSGPIGAFVMGAFVVVGLLLAWASQSYLGLQPSHIALAAVGGMASHPWGDMVTGSPPALLYPFEFSLISERVMLSADPTIHLLGAFAIELAAVALAIAVLARQMEFRPQNLVDRRALLGALYGPAAVVMVPPTIDVSYQFVFSILVVGAVIGSARGPQQGQYSPRVLAARLAGHPEAALRTTLTMLTGIAVALVSYGVVYLLAG